LTAAPCDRDATLASVSARPHEDRRTFGAVYTPDHLAQWVAELLVEHAPHALTSVLDPACGDGALLRAAQYAAPAVDLVGIDVAANAIGDEAVRSVTADTLLLSEDKIPEADGVIMNPPWGATLTASRDELRAAGYALAAGQFDSWDLFIEWSIRRMKTGTVVAAIIPDSLFLPEHKATRQMLVEQTAVRVVARLGEGWFPGVFRGVAVVVFVVGTPDDRPVTCIRVPQDVRREITAGRASLHAMAGRVAVLAQQSVWAADPLFRMDPTVGRDDVQPLARITSRGGAWTSWFDVGRGVELGKAGNVIACDACGQHLPRPKTYPARCAACQRGAGWVDVSAVSFDEPDDRSAWARLIVGEDVGRYVARPSRWLRLGLDGIAYKDAEIYRRRKLLVRKTGLGLHAAVDSSGSYTTQVVFHYLPRADAPDFALDYLQGVLCSRIMLAYYLKRSGETEWRSHPYVTPSILATLPIPRPAEGSREWSQACAIAEAVRRLRAVEPDGRARYELAVDRLVAGLFELDEHECRWATDVIASAQSSLQAFAPLVLTDPASLYAETAA
jgi:adenine-specific DNA-methyltransferase